MSKTGFDHDALAQQFAQASARQGDALPQAVQQATLTVLHGRSEGLDASAPTPAARPSSRRAGQG